MDHMASMDQMAAALRQREGARNENALLRLFEERDRQHKMAAMGGAAPAPVTSIDVMAVQPPAAVAAMPMNPPTKAKDDSAFALAGSKVTVLPCRARGMPMDHNAKVRKEVEYCMFWMDYSLFCTYIRSLTRVLSWLFLSDCLLCSSRRCQTWCRTCLFLRSMPQCRYQVPLLCLLFPPCGQAQLFQEAQA